MTGTAALVAQPALPTLEERIAERSLESIRQQFDRVFRPLLLLDVFVLWLFFRAGLLWPACALMAAYAIVNVVRFRALRRHVAGGAGAAATITGMAPVYAASGVGRAAFVPLLFSAPVQDVHYVFTMIMVGQVAGAIGSVGGVLRLFLLASAPLAAALAIAWAAQGTLNGVGIGFLMALLLYVTASYVRGSASALRELVGASEENRLLATSLRAERDRAEAASQSKTRFFAAASHDLRQPLQALSADATTLSFVALEQSDQRVRDVSLRMNRALQQTNDLLQGLLDISQLDAGAVQVEPESFDVNALLRIAADQFGESAAQRGVRLELSPARIGDDPPIACTDFGLLLRMVNNLIHNSLKFTTRGSIRLGASVTSGGADDAARWISIVVADTGCGIEPAEQAHVFEEFYQVGNRSRDRKQGLGLGLSIVRRSAVLIGATLHLQSSPGTGTRIEIRLPWAGTRAAAPTSPGEPASDQTRLDGERVLVIDDEIEIVESTLGFLPFVGCAVRGATSMAEALEVIDSGFEPTALVVDHRLRHESGTDTVAAIRRRLPNVAAVLVTGDTAPGTLQAMLASGCAVVHKPIDGIHLVKVLRALLSAARP